MRKLRIAILMHESDGENTIQDYLIYILAQMWHEEGHEIKFLFGTHRYVPADIIFVHVDLSVVPDSYLKFAARYPVGINASIKDIRKSSYSNHLLNRNDAWDGPVIIKSNNNSAGIPERRRKGIVGKIQKKAFLLIKRSKLDLLPSPMLSASDYKIFGHLDKVPSVFFYHPGAIIQKFLPEKEDDLYCTRILVFLGDKMKCSKVKSKHPIVNSETAEAIEYDVEPHPDILALKAKLGFDYGKFDYVIHKGRAILLDANKTIGNARHLINNSKMKERVKSYQHGLYSFVKKDLSKKECVF